MGFEIKDQATGLREIAGSKGRSVLRAGGSPRAQIVAITSGKGGVGKSHIALNIALVLSGWGKRTMLLDADAHLGNVDVLLGMAPRYTLSDLVLGGQPLEEVLVEGPRGLRILSASSGSLDLFEMDGMVHQRLIAVFEQLEHTADWIVVDTAAGLSPAVVDLVMSADQAVVITTPEPTAVTDAYAMVKVLSGQQPELPLKLLVNWVRSPSEAEEVFEKFNLVVKHFLGRSVEWLGFVVEDRNVSRASTRQEPFVLANPRTAASLCVHRIARKILSDRKIRERGAPLDR